jgi:hypothetical protein
MSFPSSCCFFTCSIVAIGAETVLGFLGFDRMLIAIPRGRREEAM